MVLLPLCLLHCNIMKRQHGGSSDVYALPGNTPFSEDHQGTKPTGQHLTGRTPDMHDRRPRLRTRHLPDNIKVERTDRSHRLSLQLLYAEALEQR
jgi:hypothetical protein